MKRTLVLDLGLFEPRCGSVEWSEGIVFNLLRTLAYANLQILECAGNRLPPIYGSGVRWKKEPPDEELFATIPRILKDGHADCEDLAAWRLAELWFLGETGAKFVVKKMRLVDRQRSARGLVHVIREDVMVGSPKNRTATQDVLIPGPNPTLERMRLGGLLYHIQVARADGTVEDPSALLGMGQREVG